MTSWLLAAALPALLCLGAAAQTPALPTDQARTEAVYLLTFRPDSTQPTTLTERLRLQLGSRLSRFISLNKLYADSAIAAMAQQAELQAAAQGGVPNINITDDLAARMRTVLPEAVYKLPANGQVVVCDKIFTTRYQYLAEPAGPLPWVLALGPPTTLAGYACQRATLALGGRTWEAWFTREVPVPEGPYRFYGLPGLIVKVADTRQHYVFELLQLRQLSAPYPIELPAAGTKAITRAAFRQAKADYDRNAAERLLASGNLRFNTPEEAEQFRQKARERAARKTNPLELR